MSHWKNVFQRHANTDGVSTATEGMFTEFAMKFAKMWNCFVTTFRYFFNGILLMDTFFMDRLLLFPRIN